MNEFTKKRVAEITGLTMRAIQYYTERGIVEAEIDQGEGKGATRLYSRKNLVEFGIVKSLSDYKIAFSVIRNVFGLLKMPLFCTEKPDSVDLQSLRMADDFDVTVDRGIYLDLETIKDIALSATRTTADGDRVIPDGIIGCWDRIDGPAYIYLSKFIEKLPLPQSRLIPGIKTGDLKDFFNDLDWYDACDSILIIDFQKIITSVHKV
jgi:hypothetical protein